MTFRFIEDHRSHWPVRLLCETLEVSTAGYYAWRQRPTSAQQQRRDALVVEIRAIHAEVKARYGSPRIHAELAGPRSGLLRQHRGQTDARPRHRGKDRQEVPLHDGLQP